MEAYQSLVAEDRGFVGRVPASLEIPEKTPATKPL